MNSNHSNWGRFLPPRAKSGKLRVRRFIDANFVTVPQLDQLRDLRAIELIEQIGTPDARDLLRRIANGSVATRTSRNAAESLMRLERRPHRTGEEAASLIWQITAKAGSYSAPAAHRIGGSVTNQTGKGWCCRESKTACVSGF